MPPRLDPHRKTRRSAVAFADASRSAVTSQTWHIFQESRPAGLAAALICAMLLTSPTIGRAQSANPGELNSIRTLRDQGKLEKAAMQLLAYDKESAEDLSLDFVLLARKAEGHLDINKISTLYLQAFRNLESSRPTPENRRQRTVIMTATARHFCSQQQFEIATNMLLGAMKEATATETDADSVPTLTPLIGLTMQAGWAELSAGRAHNAESLYQQVLSVLDSLPTESEVLSNRAPAMLGLGWATAQQQGRSAEAVTRLDDFLDAYPESKDAAQAAALQIHCLRLTDSPDEDKLQAATERFCKRWPTNPMSKTVIEPYLQESGDEHPESLRDSICQWIIEASDCDQWSPPMITHAMAYAGVKLPPNRFDELLHLLASQDRTGQHTAVLLARTSDAGRPAIAEQVAATLISGDLQGTSPMSQESASRWAGRTGRWSLLALAAESTTPDSEEIQRTEHVERLFAEALTQTARGKSAYLWWSHLVDDRQAQDFATLLRCAETAVAQSTVANAQQRVSHLRESINRDNEQTPSIEKVLADLLEADLFVRRLKFDSARSMLEQVVRSSSATPALRARAQWMIGETHFLQEQFGPAIDAYRQVEGLSPQSPYIPAALVQAGKSFEQLGRTREAGVCYGTLLERFADSSHAIEAQRRMAALPVNSTGSGRGKRLDTGTPASPGSPSLRR